MKVMIVALMILLDNDEIVWYPMSDCLTLLECLVLNVRLLDDVRMFEEMKLCGTQCQIV